MRKGTMIRLKIPVTPVEARSRRDSDSLSSLDLSDESGYSGVEDITGSDDDEEDVEAAEEEHILSDELQHVLQSSPRPGQEDEDEDDDDDEDEDEDEEALGDDEGGNFEGDDDDGDDATSWDGFPSEPELDEVDDLAEAHIPTVQRRVRFDVPDSDDDDDDDTETDEDTAYGFFPDLFVDKSKLDPSFRLEVDQNSDDDSDAYWDHYGSANAMGTVLEEESSDFEALLNVAEDDDTTPIATPMTQNDISTAFSTPVASPEKDEVSLDGYQCELVLLLKNITFPLTEAAQPMATPRMRKNLYRDQSDARPTRILRRRRQTHLIWRSSKVVVVIHASAVLV